MRKQMVAQKIGYDISARVTVELHPNVFYSILFYSILF
jgi:hypothetical protein